MRKQALTIDNSRTLQPVGRRSNVLRKINVVLLSTLLALLISTFLFASTSAKAAPVDGPLQLTELTMIDQQNGWSLERNPTRVLHTSTGPEQWHDVTPRGLNLPDNDIFNSITASFFLDANHGYLGVFQDGATFLLLTEDGGQTWNRVPFDFSPFTYVGIYQIDFLDAQHGWLAFDKDHGFGHFQVVLMSTSDGGKTWQQLLDTTEGPASGLPDLWPKHFKFTDTLHGWVTGNENNAPDVRLYVTSDGGKTWSHAKIPTLPNATYSESYGPFFRDNKYGTLPVLFGNDTGDGQYLTVYRTTDGGKTWTMGPVLSTTSFTEFRMLTFNTANDGRVLGTDVNGNPVLHETHNGGKTWQTIYPTGLTNFTEVIYDLDFLTASKGWTINQDNNGTLTLFETHNGGRSWQVLQPVMVK